ncbi:Uncharacterised protein [Brevundimonas vancanneytii]|uniref:MFS transporter n=1 Tax=Brevundimonas vancanneytii TaxID=1325724 RepID=A0A4P1KJ63_9CAUL|nr:Uncharacterised protein [Brevundimonas vancanneytii]
MSQIEAAKADAGTVDARAASAGLSLLCAGILILIYMLNFLDRQIIGILAAPLKAEFNLSDSQFGLLGGLAFALLYSTLAIPIAWLAIGSAGCGS